MIEYWGSLNTFNLPLSSLPNLWPGKSINSNGSRSITAAICLLIPLVLLFDDSICLLWIPRPSWWGKIFGKWSPRNRRMRLRCEESVRRFIGDAKTCRFCYSYLDRVQSCPQHLTPVSLTKATKQSWKYCRKLMLLRIHSFVSEETRPTESGRKICPPAGGRGKRKFGHFLGGGLDAGHICGR